MTGEIDPPDRLLMGPGPVNAHPRVLRAMLLAAQALADKAQAQARPAPAKAGSPWSEDEDRKLLAAFDPRLTGAVISGAISDSHRVQLHAFPDKAELVDIFLADRGFEVTPDERDYRYSDGRVESIPLARFEAGGIGVDVALFAPGQERRAPLSPTQGTPSKRLTLVQVEALAAQTIEGVLDFSP